eukprot:PhM_4_TR14114/c0_g1_i1/m.42926
MAVGDAVCVLSEEAVKDSVPIEGETVTTSVVEGPPDGVKLEESVPSVDSVSVVVAVLCVPVGVPKERDGVRVMMEDALKMDVSDSDTVAESVLVEALAIIDVSTRTRTSQATATSSSCP